VVDTVTASGFSAPPEPGRFGPFYLQELINSGGMADIWLATDDQHKAYALRRMHRGLRFNLMARRRFVHGCEVLAQVSDHEGIIGYVSHGKVGGQWYCLMEYIEAANLRELYTRQDVVLQENVAQILIDMAVGLEHMHGKGFMHLDFKPENVLVSRNGKVRLIDFDLAQPIPAKPRKPSGRNPGTPSYMAPEQLLGQPISHHVDIFAFGVTAYELLTNHKPFVGETPADILRAQLDPGALVAPRHHNPDVPANLERVILRCLQVQPDHRHPVIGVMVRDLKEALYV
jgi:eukaryotic-like serine/threonine-protein kinase